LVHPIGTAEHGITGSGGKGNIAGTCGRDSIIDSSMPSCDHFNCSILIFCRDRKSRRIPATAESVFLMLADGVSGAMDERFAEYGFPLAQKVKNGNIGLKGFGNAIVPQVAAMFVEAFNETTKGGEG
jgi:hypothetical protein